MNLQGLIIPEHHNEPNEQGGNRNTYEFAHPEKLHTAGDAHEFRDHVS